jgi:hypothetical protein
MNSKDGLFRTSRNERLFFLGRSFLHRAHRLLIEVGKRHEARERASRLAA